MAFKKNLVQFDSPTLLLIAIFSMYLISCKGNESNNQTVLNKAFKINCVTLSKSQIQSWVDSGWTNPKNDTIRYLILQPLTANPAEANRNLQLISYPAKSLTTIFNGSEKILPIDTTCVTLPLTDTTIFSNNYVQFKKLKITNPDGSLIDFDFIRFKPVKKFPKFISYEMEIIKLVGDQKTEKVILKLSGGETADPCPPYCPSDAD